MELRRGQLAVPLNRSMERDTFIPGTQFLITFTPQKMDENALNLILKTEEIEALNLTIYMGEESKLTATNEQSVRNEETTNEIVKSLHVGQRTVLTGRIISRFFEFSIDQRYVGHLPHAIPPGRIAHLSLDGQSIFEEMIVCSPKEGHPVIFEPNATPFELILFKRGESAMHDDAFRRPPHVISMIFNRIRVRSTLTVKCIPRKIFRIRLEGSEQADLALMAELEPGVNKSEEKVEGSVTIHDEGGEVLRIPTEIFKRRKECKIEIAATEDAYEISIDGQFISSLKHRFPPSNVEKVVLDGSAKFNEILLNVE